MPVHHDIHSRKHFRQHSSRTLRSEHGQWWPRVSYPKAVPAVTGFYFSRVSKALTTPFFSFTIQDGQPIRMLIHLYSLASSLLSRLLSSVVGRPLGSVVGRHDQLRLVWNASWSCELQVWNTSWSAPVLVSSQLLVDSSSLDQYSAPFDSPFRIWSPHPV